MSKKKSILLVEDEENLQEALKLNLELEDYDVSSAYDGAEALKFVQQEYFDLMNQNETLKNIPLDYIFLLNSLSPLPLN